MTIADMIYSSTADKMGYKEQYNISDSISSNLMSLMKTLQQIENETGLKLHVNSGYRCPRTNKAVGGAETSYHVFGKAADITSSDNRKLWEHCKLRKDYTELIYYFQGDPVPEFIHIAKDDLNLKFQIKICYLDSSSGKAVRRYKTI